MGDAKVRQLWEQYPKAVGEVAKREPIFCSATTRTFVPTAQTNMLYQPGIDRAENPGNYPETPEAKAELARSILEASTDLQIADLREKLAAFRYIELTWPGYKAKMLENKGFADWMFTGGVVFSFYMYMFYTEIDGFMKFSPEVKQELNMSTTFQMDAAYGEYHDVFGRRVRFPAGNVIWWHIMNHGLWRGVHWRGPWFNCYLRQVGRGESVVDLCSGALNAEKRFGYPQRQDGPKVIAYDKDPNVKNVLPQFFEKPLESYGFEFREDDFRAAGNDPELLGKQALVLMQGGMSYYVPETLQTLELMRKLLKKGGRAVFETEVLTYDMKQTVLVLGLKDQHETMMPDQTVEAATARITDAVKAVGGFEIEQVLSDTGFHGEGVVPTTALFVLKAI